MRFVATLTSQRAGYLGVELPDDSATVLGTRAQVPVTARVGGLTFDTLVFPTGDGHHFMFVNSRVRNQLHVEAGDQLEVSVRARPPTVQPVRLPPELEAAFRASHAARAAWESLPAGARRIASRWIDGAKAADVRAWRTADVLRRAARAYRGEGPFYPTKEDQARLSRPQPKR